MYTGNFYTDVSHTERASFTRKQYTNKSPQAKEKIKFHQFQKLINIKNFFFNILSELITA